MVEKVIACQFSRQFKKEYNKLPKEIQKAFDEKLPLFLKKISHPSLRVKRNRKQNLYFFHSHGEGIHPFFCPEPEMY